MTYLFFETLLMQFVVAALFCALGIWIGRRLPSLVPQSAGEVAVEGVEVTQLDRKAPEADASKEALEKAEAELRQLRLLNDKLQAELEVKPADIEEAKEEEAPTEDAPASPVSEGRDDLMKLRGVGKVMAEKLEKLGVVAYRQIAGWSKHDINGLPFKNRVVRDRWQEQARRFHKEKYGEKL